MATLYCGALHVILVATRMEILLVRWLLIYAQTTAFSQPGLHFSPFVQLKLSVKHITDSYISVIKVLFQSCRLQQIATEPKLQISLIVSAKNLTSQKYRYCKHI
jgi:hypothetical protein